MLLPLIVSLLYMAPHPLPLSRLYPFWVVSPLVRFVMSFVRYSDLYSRQEDIACCRDFGHIARYDRFVAVLCSINSLGPLLHIHSYTVIHTHPNKSSASISRYTQNRSIRYYIIMQDISLY
jgi:hypothetical protein